MNDSGLVDHCLELLSPLGAASAKRMFGGNALYIDGLCVALVLRDALYLKVDDASRPLFEAARCRPFTYETTQGERGILSYYTAPEEAMESPDDMLPWARRALAAAVAARAKAPPKKKPAVEAAAKQSPARQAARPAAKTAATKKPSSSPGTAPPRRRTTPS